MNYIYKPDSTWARHIAGLADSSGQRNFGKESIARIIATHCHCGPSPLPSNGDELQDARGKALAWLDKCIEAYYKSKETKASPKFPEDLMGLVDKDYISSDTETEELPAWSKAARTVLVTMGLATNDELADRSLEAIRSMSCGTTEIRDACAKLFASGLDKRIAHAVACGSYVFGRGYLLYDTHDPSTENFTNRFPIGVAPADPKKHEPRSDMLNGKEFLYGFRTETWFRWASDSMIHDFIDTVKAGHLKRHHAERMTPHEFEASLLVMGEPVTSDATYRRLAERLLKERGFSGSMVESPAAEIEMNGYRCISSVGTPEYLYPPSMIIEDGPVADFISMLTGSPSR